MKRICIILLCALIVLGVLSTAYAAGAYKPLDVEVTIGGTGTFLIKREGASDSDALNRKYITGSGSITVTVREPMQYRYELFSTDAQNSMRYDVIVEVMTDENNRLVASVTITEHGQDRKLPVAYYPPAPIDPLIKKYVIGDKPPKNEAFHVIFRGVSTTVPELKGTPPMPADAKRQSKRLTIVGAGKAEAGEIILPRAGRYVYEFREERGYATGYTYDKSVIRAVYDVVEGPRSLEVVETFYRDGVKIQAAEVNFVNRYTTPPTDDPTEPTTGNPQEPTTGNPQEPTTGNPQEPTTGNPQEPTTGNPQEPTTGKPQEPTTGKPQEPTTGGKKVPHTGDSFHVWFWIGLLLISLAAGMLTIVTARKSRRGHRK